MLLQQEGERFIGPGLAGPLHAHVFGQAGRRAMTRMRMQPRMEAIEAVRRAEVHGRVPQAWAHRESRESAWRPAPARQALCPTWRSFRVL